MTSPLRIANVCNSLLRLVSQPSWPKLRFGTRAIDAGIVFLLLTANLLLIAPYLGTDFSSQPWNNDYAYLAMERMLRDHSWTWNPMQYGGAPFNYVYPPLFHILMIALPVRSLGRAYHLMSGFGYALVPVSLYILCLQLFRSRSIAAAAALAYSFFPSPVYFLLSGLRNLAQPFHFAPWSFIALNGYAEVPHLFSVSFTILAVAAAWRDCYKTAAALAAVVFLTSWPGLLALQMVLVCVAVAQTRKFGCRGAIQRLIATAGISYGLTAFWMTPGFFSSSMLINRVVLRHEGSAGPWNLTTSLILLCASGLLAIAFWRRVPAPFALLLSWAAISGTVVAAFSLAGNGLLPLSHRYVMEFNICLILCVAGAISLFRRSRAALVIVFLLWGAIESRDFLRNAWKLQPHSIDPSQSVAFQIANWLGHNSSATSRVLVAGELDGSLNLWQDVPQVGGTRQGISNPLFIAAQRQVIFGCGAPERQAAIAGLWLRALDTRYVVVHSASSREYFHWFVQPEEFAALPIAWTNNQGDTVYRATFPEHSQAVVVDLDAFAKLPRLRSTADETSLAAYVNWAEGKRHARIDWKRPDTADLEADLEPNEGLLVKVNYDRGWSAASSSLSADPLGFLLVRPPTGHQHLLLHFNASAEVWLGRVITLITLGLLILRASPALIGLVATIPAALALAVITSNVPQRIAVAEEAFIRLHPPLINPGGIIDTRTENKLASGEGGIASIYGIDFGGRDDQVSVWVGYDRATILYRNSNQLNVRLLASIPNGAKVVVEVNGCRGNSFPLPGTNYP